MNEAETGAVGPGVLMGVIGADVHAVGNRHPVSGAGAGM